MWGTHILRLGKQRQRNYHKFESRLVYTVSSKSVLVNGLIHSWINELMDYQRSVFESKLFALLSRSHPVSFLLWPGNEFFIRHTA